MRAEIGAHDPELEPGGLRAGRLASLPNSPSLTSKGRAKRHRASWEKAARKQPEGSQRAAVSAQS